MTKISVIIPTYNSSKTIVKTINAIKNQEGLDESAEIIVVDDGSTDNSLNLLKQIENIRVFSQENSGPATARNLGAKNANGDILVFTDSDTVPHNNWLKELIEPFKDFSIKATTGTYSNENKESFLAQLIQSEIEYKHNNYSDFVAFGGSYNLAIRKDLYFKIGGFNEDYKSASGEDNDISYKIIRSGYRIKFVKKAVVGHFHPERIIKYLKTQFKHGYWRAKLYFDFPKRLSGDSYTGSKEICETFLAGLTLFSIVMYFVGKTLCICQQCKKTTFIKWIMSFSVIMLGGIEFDYVAMINRNNKSQLGLLAKLNATIVFLLRSIFRTLGFIKGLFCFFKFS